MTYKMLIGQNVLNKGNFLIDPSKNAETEDNEGRAHFAGKQARK